MSVTALLYNNVKQYSTLFYLTDKVVVMAHSGVDTMFSDRARVALCNWLTWRLGRPTLMKQTWHDKAGVQVDNRDNRGGDNLGFGLKRVEEFVYEVAHAFLALRAGVQEWQRTMRVLDAARGADSLVNGWLQTQTPTLAYAVLLEPNRVGRASKFYPVRW